MIESELLQTIKPILFNTDMVRAILDGRKTVTRRVVKHDIDAILNSSFHHEHPEVPDKTLIEKLCLPPYQPGGVLYVRETWQHLYELDGNDQIIEDTGKYYYAASDTLLFDIYVDSMGVTHENIPWRPSIHMPKEAARIFLRVTDVRVERLQNMPHDGPMKEGIHFCECPDGFTWKEQTNVNNCYISPMAAMKALWDSTIKRKDLDRYCWNANPWVWVISFERISKEQMITGGENANYKPR